uniref:protein Wnt-5-like n=1 Tax=Styela clava TaxID=7725 RepID=UPI00193991BF|nr:protein Wnt-5-like [Styela clava]
MHLSQRSILLYVRFLIAFTFNVEVNSHWWSMSNKPLSITLDNHKTKSICEYVEGLSRNQKTLCRRYYNHMSFVSEGAQNGINECQHQFDGHRWNCSTVKDSSVFGKVLKIGSKETAFTYAVAAAGVVYSVAKGCKSDTLGTCGCSRKQRPMGLAKEWRWGGCGDDTDYAYGFAREFIDARERDNLSPRGRKERARKIMNMHNNEAGRMAAVRATRPACKCHGVSGSCSLKSCWYQVPDFRVIGDMLKVEHKRAIEMRMNKRGLIRPRKRPREAPFITDLIFIESSPDYCRRNTRTGVLGTRGRECKLNSRGMDGCGLLCCGRGYRTKMIEVTERCNCKFEWCCEVRCQKCKRKIVQYTCK